MNNPTFDKWQYFNQPDSICIYCNETIKRPYHNDFTDQFQHTYNSIASTYLPSHNRCHNWDYEKYFRKKYLKNFDDSIFTEWLEYVKM